MGRFLSRCQHQYAKRREHYHYQPENKNTDDDRVDHYSGRIILSRLAVVFSAAAAAFNVRQDLRPEDSAPPREAEFFSICGTALRAGRVRVHCFEAAGFFFWRRSQTW